ncbi:beta-ketoacyl-[acyl-carrier-protein] synthase family protein [Marinobacter mangrovi]|uniref:beta-ketoacyl-[acyl-carrier-protein] synthase family protein n=1 Tax=Marinobacter mangrovi TaxID=2803918 RepID=UPI00193414DE|nr:beta-ketoacyl-[acyl-carrier-protein] synthase family protein [Marinobacter mangrovi]
MTETCYLNATGILCAAGASYAELSRQFQRPGKTLTQSSAFSIDGRSLPLGMYRGALPPVHGAGDHWDGRNNRMAQAALEQMRPDVEAAIARYGSHRVGVVIGTSTSGIGDNEPGIRHWVQSGKLPDGFAYSRQEMGAPAAFIAECLGISGPVYGMSTACSSGAKTLATARRLIRSGFCDAVIAGGVDTLCAMTINGFSALEAVSDSRCNPFSRNRNGINIGEGAALFLVSREPGPVFLAGVGENSDAHHISAPDPSGQGAIGVMRAALEDASLGPEAIDYLNLHGTATRLNDQMEATAVHQVLGPQVACSSTKPVTGHTLGAAGAIEAGFCWQLLAQTPPTSLPVHLWDNQPDPDLPSLNLVQPGMPQSVRYVMSNSFAFGGNNICLILGKSHETNI